MNRNQQTACPACEYERNATGRPVERNGQMECLDCGSKWRVFGTLNQQKQTPATPVVDELTYARVTAPFLSGNEPEPVNEKTTRRQSLIPGTGIAVSAFAVFALFACLFFGVQFLQSQTKPAELNTLNIAEVEIKEQIRRNGEKVFTVEGIVSNPTNTSMPIPPIAIILRQKNGDEIFRWHYTSSLSSLEAGAMSRFASSVQYDTPIVAYAEAVFRN